MPSPWFTLRASPRLTQGAIAAALVIVMRDTTERPEAIAAGTASLVGTSPDRVYAAVRRLLTSPHAYRRMANAVNPYGDGHAAQRAVRAIEHMFGLAALPQPFEPELHSAAA